MLKSHCWMFIVYTQLIKLQTLLDMIDFFTNYRFVANYKFVMKYEFVTNCICYKLQICYKLRRVGNWPAIVTQHQPTDDLCKYALRSCNSYPLGRKKNVWKSDKRWEPVKFKVCQVCQVLILILGTCWTTFVFMSDYAQKSLFLCENGDGFFYFTTSTLWFDQS